MIKRNFCKFKKRKAMKSSSKVNLSDPCCDTEESCCCGTKMRCAMSESKSATSVDSYSGFAKTTVILEVASGSGSHSQLDKSEYCFLTKGDETTSGYCTAETPESTTKLFTDLSLKDKPNSSNRLQRGVDCEAQSCHHTCHRSSKLKHQRDRCHEEQLANEMAEQLPTPSMSRQLVVTPRSSATFRVMSSTESIVLARSRRNISLSKVVSQQISYDEVPQERRKSSEDTATQCDCAASCSRLSCSAVEKQPSVVTQLQPELSPHSVHFVERKPSKSSNFEFELERKDKKVNICESKCETPSANPNNSKSHCPGLNDTNPNNIPRRRPHGFDSHVMQIEPYKPCTNDSNPHDATRMQPRALDGQVMQRDSNSACINNDNPNNALRRHPHAFDGQLTQCESNTIQLLQLINLLLCHRECTCHNHPAATLANCPTRRNMNARRPPKKDARSCGDRSPKPKKPVRISGLHPRKPKKKVCIGNDCPSQSKMNDCICKDCPVKKQFKSHCIFNPRFKGALIPKYQFSRVYNSPVDLYHFYKCEWNYFRKQIPDEQATRPDLRWLVREKMLDPH